MRAVPERVLTSRELGRAMLARQLLLERRPLPLARAVERMGCVQSQYAPSTYVGLWSRVDGLRREAVTRALERRTLVQSTLMRSTIRRLAARLLAARDRDPRGAARLGAACPGRRRTGLRRAAERLRSLLADGPRSQKEIAEAGLWLPGIGLWADLVRVPPAGTWERRRADLFGLAEAWVGPEPELSEVEARQHLVRRYLGAFGPATRTDIANWAGMRVGALAETLEGMELRRFSDEQGHELLDLPRAPLPGAEIPVPVRFLPTWDAILLVHARRTGILADEHRTLLFNSSNPQSERTFLVDGQVAGSWRPEGGRVRLEPFGRLSRASRAELRRKPSG